MLISYFGKTKEGKFESFYINYPTIFAPLTPETHQYFKRILDQIKKHNKWVISMFNPVPDHLRTQGVGG